MKKIMIAAAIAAYCGAVSATGIESQNIVGYQTKSVRKYLSQQVCTFDQIGVAGGALDIQKLIPVDSEGGYVGDGAVNIQFKSNRGALQSSYAYYGEDEYDDDCPAGWYNEKTDELAVYSFNAGEAFQVSSSVACYFMYSGEVNMSETYVPFGQYLSMQGNIRPTAIDIQSVIPKDGTDESAEYIGDGAVTIQFASDRGALQTSYAYYGEDEYDDDCPAGWYNEKTDELAVYTFAAGEGFKISATKAGYLCFPEL